MHRVLGVSFLLATTALIASCKPDSPSPAPAPVPNPTPSPTPPPPTVYHTLAKGSYKITPAYQTPPPIPTWTYTIEDSGAGFDKILIKLTVKCFIKNISATGNGTVTSRSTPPADPDSGWRVLFSAPVKESTLSIGCDAQNAAATTLVVSEQAVPSGAQTFDQLQGPNP